MAPLKAGTLRCQPGFAGSYLGDLEGSHFSSAVSACSSVPFGDADELVFRPLLLRKLDFRRLLHGCEGLIKTAGSSCQGKPAPTTFSAKQCPRPGAFGREDYTQVRARREGSAKCPAPQASKPHVHCAFKSLGGRGGTAWPSPVPGAKLHLAPLPALSPALRSPQRAGGRRAAASTPRRKRQGCPAPRRWAGGAGPAHRPRSSTPGPEPLATGRDTALSCFSTAHQPR